MSGAGDYRTRLLLQIRNDVADGQGGTLRSFSDVKMIWAHVMPLPSREGVIADTEGATQRLRIETRSPLSISLAHRLVDGAKVYRITGYRDDGRLVTIEAAMRIA